MKNGLLSNYFEKFGCLTTIVLIVVAVILCNKVDYLCYITKEPVEYCMKFPSGRYQDRALDKIIDKLNNDYSYFATKFETQRKIAAFIQPLPESPQKDALEKISIRWYEYAKRKAHEEVFTADFDWQFVEDFVEDKYKPEIASIRADLERRWQKEQSAWDIVCNAKLTLSTDKQRLLEYYLEYYPNGEHAKEANELLVSVLEEELSNSE